MSSIFLLSLSLLTTAVSADTERQTKINTLLAQRQALIATVWGSAGLPKTGADLFVKNYQDPGAYADVLAMKPDFLKIDRLDYMEFNTMGLLSKSVVFRPQNPNGHLMILHGGHDGHWMFTHADTIFYLVNRGYTVAAFSMPVHDPNPSAVVTTPRGRKVTIASHQDFIAFEQE